MTSPLDERLRAGVVDRARYFGERVRAEAAVVRSSAPGVRHALELFAHYSDVIVREVKLAWEEAQDYQYRLATMRSLRNHMRLRVEMFDSRFSRGSLVVPRALSAAVEAEARRVGLNNREAVLTVGPPSNFSTFIADLREFLFLDMEVDLNLPPHLADLNMIIIAVPELEGTRASWQPVVTGHELAHYFQVAKPIAQQVGLESSLDRRSLAATKDKLPPSPLNGSTRTRILEQVAARWMNELICDAYAVHRYGAAAVASLTEYLESVGATHLISGSHPPGALRASLMFKWLTIGPEGNNRTLTELEREIAEPFRALSGDIAGPDWVRYLSTVMAEVAAKIWSAVATWHDEPAYQDRDRAHVVRVVAERLIDGIPGVQTVEDSGATIEVEPPDVLNACWQVKYQDSGKPIGRLTLKALDTLDFLDRWRAAGGETKVDDGNDSDDTPSVGALTGADIAARLKRNDDLQIVVTPTLPTSVAGASMDLRLGNKFIVFERSNAAVFDSLDKRQDPRSIQSTVERTWGDVFYLHPGQLVLAASLEFIRLPLDLTAQVITRSSYGRLGLISATAVQVHPGFAGCLTLELVNLGEMPMAITPGERVAQLLFFATSSKLKNSEAATKYRYPTGPEFSKIAADHESDVLRGMRDQFLKRAHSSG